ncbi:MAG: conjugal transfer protein TraF [Nanoarchaeota archaeon]|nr:conjugal transfer protein TraF [Nanoarchaeota archaeon]
MERKKLNRQRVLLAFLLTVIIFSTGVFIGNYFTSSKMMKVNDLGDSLKLDTLGVEVQYEILKENICAKDYIIYLTDELFELGEKLSFMEYELGPDNEKVIELKKYYFILEAKHILLAKTQIEQCFDSKTDAANSIILYFYSNEGDCKYCDQQSTALQYLLAKNKDIKIYSFDNNIDSPVVRAYKQIYDIGEYTPVLVVNDKTYYGLYDTDQIMELINET